MGRVDIIDIPCIPSRLEWGRLPVDVGRSACPFIRNAIELAVVGGVDAICTGVLNNAALRPAGHDCPGDTEVLATS